MTDTITLQTDDRVTLLTINRPQKRNAITQQMYGVMADALKAYEASDTQRAFVITGAEDYFTAGNDLQDFSMADHSGDLPPVARFLEAISTCKKPVIAAVNGPAIGIGLTMLLHCDLVDAAASFYALREAIGGPIAAASEFESAMADVRKEESLSPYGASIVFEVFFSASASLINFFVSSEIVSSLALAAT